MSLLGGLKFTKKRDRATVVQRETSEAKKRHKKEKKGKKQKKESKERKRRQDSSDSDGSSSDDDNNAQALSTEEMNSLAAQSARDDAPEKKKDVESKFSKLLSQASKWKEGKGELKNTVESADTEKADNSSSKSNSNQSVAQLLRQQLKKSKAVLKPTEQQSFFQEPSSSNSSSSVFVNDKRFHMNKKILEKGRYGGSEKAESDSMASLVAAERAGGDDMDEIYASNILRLGNHFKGSELNVRKGEAGAFGAGDSTGMDEEEEIDMTMFQRSSDPMAMARNQISAAIRQAEKLDKSVARCTHCQTISGKAHQHLLVYSGEHCVVRLKPSNLSISPGHVEIFPKQHADSFLKLDENIFEEMRQIRTALKCMYVSEGMGVLFTECAVNLPSTPHCVQDCIPIPQGMELEAKFSFRESFTDVNSEFAQNAKIYELTAERTVRRVIPSHFEYLWVEWGEAQGKEGSNTGLAHVIHDESDDGSGKIKRDFLLDIACSCLGEDPMRMRYKARVDDQGDKREAQRVRNALQKYI